MICDNDYDALLVKMIQRFRLFSGFIKLFLHPRFHSPNGTKPESRTLNTSTSRQGSSCAVKLALCIFFGIALNIEYEFDIHSESKKASY